MAGSKGRSGRKPEEVNQIVKQHIQAALDKDPEAMSKIWDRVVLMAQQGSEKHTQLLFNYYYGKPKENLEQPTELIIKVSHE